MAVWYDNINWFIFYPHGEKADDKVWLYECLVQKGRIESSDMRKLPPLNNAIDAPNALTGNSSSWALNDFQRLCKYMKEKNMAVNCQGICYHRLFPMDKKSKLLGPQRFWVRVFDLIPLNRFGLTPKPLTPRQELYIELAPGDPTIKVPGNSADVISVLNTKVRNLETDRDSWKKISKDLEKDRDDWKKISKDLETKVASIESSRDYWQNKYNEEKAKPPPPPPVKPSNSDVAFDRGYYLSPEGPWVKIGVIPNSNEYFGTPGVSSSDYFSQCNTGNSSKGERLIKSFYITKAYYNEWRNADLTGNEYIISRPAVRVLRYGNLVMWRALQE